MTSKKKAVQQPVEARPTRWPDGTPKSSNNAFTGDAPRASGVPSRAQVLNGALPGRRAR